MKRMVVYVTAFMLSCMVFAGCSFLEELLAVVPAISLEDPSQAELSFDDGSGSVSVGVTANFGWTAVSGAKWCMASPAAGNGDAQVIISVTANNTGLERETEVVIGNDIVKVRVKVWQEADDQLSVEGGSHVVPAAGGRVSFKVVSNVKYTVEFPEVDWLEQVQTGLANDYILTVSPNEGYEGRKAVISVKSAGIERTVEVMQLQKDAIVLQDSEVTLSHGEGTFSLMVGSNVSYEVRTSAEWLTLVESKAFEEKELIFGYTANPNPYERSATITLTDGNITQFVDVVQGYEAVEYRLSFTHDNLSVWVPAVSGENLTGTVFWGDGQEEAFSMDNFHQYGSPGTRTVELEFIGVAGGVEVEFETLEGIQEIDLTGL